LLSILTSNGKKANGKKADVDLSPIRLAFLPLVRRDH
jgi:hypothetical protein